MDAVFALEHTVGVLTLDENAGGFDARLVAVEIVKDLVGQAMLLGPVRVHPVEHRGPVLRLGAACARLERDDGVVIVIFAGKKRLKPCVFHLLLELGIALGQFGEHGVVVVLQRHFAERIQIVPLAAHFFVSRDLGLQRPALLHDLLRDLLIVPEALGIDLRVQAVDFLFRGLNAEGVRQRVQLGADIIELYLIFIEFNHAFPTLFKIVGVYYTGKPAGCKGETRILDALCAQTLLRLTGDDPGLHDRVDAFADLNGRFSVQLLRRNDVQHVQPDLRVLAEHIVQNCAGIDQ